MTLGEFINSDSSIIQIEDRMRTDLECYIKYVNFNDRFFNKHIYGDLYLLTLFHNLFLQSNFLLFN